MAKPPNPKTLIFEQAKLQAMTEPLTVRVERTKGNAKQSMPLPIRDGYNAPGQGWTQDEVMTLEQWTLASFGGGTYQFTVTDASNPTEQMVWIQVFPIGQYPEKVPAPAGMEAIIQPQGFNPMAPQNPGPGSMPSAAPWPPPMPPAPWAVGPAQPQQPQTYGVPQMSQPPQFPYNPWAWSAQGPWSTPQPQQRAGDDYRSEAEKARLATLQVEAKAQIDRLLDENRRLAESIQKANAHPAESSELKVALEREREARHAAELQAERAAFEARLAVTMAAQKPTGPSPEELRAQRDDENRRRDEENRRREEERREIREENRKREEAQQRREEAAAARLEALLAQPKGPDPMLTMFMQMMMNQGEAAKETARQQAETARDIARSQADAAKEVARMNADVAKEAAREKADLMNGMKPYMMSPLETARLVNDASQGQHQFVKSMATTFNDVAGVMSNYMRGMMENMQGPAESPVVRVVEGGIASAKEMFDRWNASKAQVDVARMQAQRDVEKARADAMRPFIPGEAAQVAQQQATAAAPVVDAGLNGAATAPAAPSSGKLRVDGKTDEELFGPGLPDIERLREGALAFCHSVAMNPPRVDANGRPVGVGPDIAAQSMVQAAQMIEAQKIQIHAFDYYWKQQMYPSLVLAIFPDVHPGYREDTLKYLWRLVEGKPLHDASEMQQQIAHDGDDENDDEEDDGQDPGPDQDAVVVPAPSRKAKAASNGRARAS